MNPNIIPVVYPAATETEPMMTRNERMERASLSQRYPMQRHTIQRYPVQRYPAQECPVQRYINLSINERPSFFMSRPLVRAAGLLNENSMTEIIDVNTLPQKNTSIIRNSVIEIINIGGQLHCLNEPISSSYWLKMITLATDFQNANVLLRVSNNGLVLKTIREILPGKPLFMWFAECVLNVLNIPFLTPANCNIEGQIYTCHICNNCFDYPNPLKLHLLLDCNQKDNSYIWTLLANKIVSPPRTNLSFNQYSERSFTFELNPLPVSRPITLPVNIPSYSTQTADTNRSLRNDSPCSSNQLSPLSSNNPSPSPTYPLPTEILPSSSTYKSSVENLMDHRLILRSYNALTHRDRIMPYMLPSNAPAESGKKTDPAEVETRASEIGKCNEGYRCIFCNKIYSRKYGLRIHIRTHTGYKPLTCKVCEHRFGDPSNLNKHVRLHVTDDSRYKCDICGKVLVRRRDLERHKNSWHSEKNDDNVSDVGINSGI
ncbi:zinc finger protein Xfin [Formica exsecta]|uniref:zinc finger protein Xfin n=1 Tax=Formica exsecta TaxID=72781 RepID=UPI0011412AAD|nr:zinc finger protein Xfin [Formica exsecta]